MEMFLLIFSFVFSLSLFLIYKKVCIKLNIVDLPTLSNVHKRTVPTASGLIFYVVFLLSFLIVSLIYGAQINFFLIQKNFIILIISLSLLTIVSFYDDLKDIHPIIRLFIQLTVVFICTSLFDLSNIHVSLKIIIFIIVYFWVYIMNIINFTDGVDGFLTINSLNFFFFIFYYFYQSNDYNISFYISLILFIASLCKFISILSCFRFNFL
jgi:UDP-N-acetylmuramyl pentapeptide phosphotransferase/UDP-N-acetylglucosamine-1-phosphate transferase